MPRRLTPDGQAAVIVRALATGAGIPGSKVVWKAANANAPAPPSMLLKIGGHVPLGIDYLAETFDAARVGREVKLETAGFREVMLDVEVFTASPPANAGASSATGIANRLVSSLLLPNVREPLRRAGFVPVDTGPVQPVPDLVNVGFRGRALVTIRGTMPAAVVEDFTTYIASFSGELAASGGPSSSPLVLPFTVPSKP